MSAGVAENKLLAKLASRAAKPDGVVVLSCPQEVQQLLRNTPVARLPGAKFSIFMTGYADYTFVFEALYPAVSDAQVTLFDWFHSNLILLGRRSRPST